jgi:riboflavin kinase/FMN adenylyltransferase
MIVHYTLDNFGKIKYPVLTIGSFDGVHLGHRTILTKLVETAKKEKGESIVFSFFPHPRQVLYPDNYQQKYLNTQSEKIELIEKLDHLIFFPFTSEFSKLSYKDFVRLFLVEKMQIKKIIIGYDYHFGKDREGNFSNLSILGKQFGFEVEQIRATGVAKAPYSSTKTREALTKGNIKLANDYLGYDYNISGKVVKGNQLGRQLGFPTANIQTNDNSKLIPAFGVYATNLMLDGIKYHGMLNIGIRPTFNLTEPTMEVNIFDFDKDIYNEAIRVYFVDRIRDEIKFPDITALKNQLHKDKEDAFRILC